MAILEAKCQAQCPEFKMTLTLNAEEVKVEFHGGEGISPERIAFFFYNLSKGLFVPEIIQGLEHWGGDKEDVKVMKILGVWSQLKQMNSEEDKYCIHPLEVFKIANMMNNGGNDD